MEKHASPQAQSVIENRIQKLTNVRESRKSLLLDTNSQCGGVCGGGGVSNNSRVKYMKK